MQKLISEAKHYRNNSLAAFDKCLKALDICNKNKLKEDAAYIHSYCAELLLQTRSYYQAYRHTDVCIKLCPAFDKVHVHVFMYFTVQ